MVKSKRWAHKKRRDKKTNTASRKIHAEAASAHKIILSHPCINKSAALPESRPDGGFKIEFNMQVSLPSRALEKRVTQTGVRAVEPITFVFPPISLSSALRSDETAVLQLSSPHQPGPY